MNLIYVIGTARSGTSALATLVQKMGAVTLPMTVLGKYNPNYQENAIVNALCEAIHPWHEVRPKDDRRHFWEAMALYIVEHVHQKGEPGSLIIKSPCFPFMVPELRQVARFIQTLGIECKPHFLVSHRHGEAIAASANKFTEGVFGPDHWRRLQEIAYRRISSDLGEDGVHISYEDLVEDWVTEAKRIAIEIPDLRIPEYGGIEKSLNHEGLQHAK